MKKLYIYILVGVILLGTASYFVFSGSSVKGPKYRTEKASRGNVTVQVRATGTVNPVRTVQVGSQVSGILSKINVDFNSKVRKGEILAVIDSTFLYASVKEAQANVDRARASLGNSSRIYQRSQDLFAKQLISQADLDAAHAAAEADQASLKQTQAALDRTLVNLQYAVIRAPIDGVVISRDVDVGQTVAASLQTPKLFSIAEDLNNMQVEASVDEADIGQIKEGQRVTFTVDSYPDEQFRGAVSQVRLSPVTVQNVVTYTVIIAVPNPDLKLRPGMTATVSILIDRRENVVRVPALALRFQPPQDSPDKAATQTGQSTGQTTGQQGGQRMGGQSSGGQGQSGRGDSSRTHGGGQWGGDHKQMAPDAPKTGHVYVLDSSGNPKIVNFTLGLNDNRYVEVLGDLIKEGDDIILALNGTDATASAAQGQQNPFQPRMGGPGGGGGRGR